MSCYLSNIKILLIWKLFGSKKGGKKNSVVCAATMSTYLWRFLAKNYAPNMLNLNYLPPYNRINYVTLQIFRWEIGTILPLLARNLHKMARNQHKIALFHEKTTKKRLLLDRKRHKLSNIRYFAHGLEHNGSAVNWIFFTFKSQEVWVDKSIQHIDYWNYRNEWNY